MQDLTADLEHPQPAAWAPVLTFHDPSTVGFGIGATTAIFSAVHAVLLKPLPYANPDRLVRIYTDTPPFKFRFSIADYLAFRDQQTQVPRTKCDLHRSRRELQQRRRRRRSCAAGWSDGPRLRRPRHSGLRSAATSRLPTNSKGKVRGSRSSATVSGSSASAAGTTRSDRPSVSMAKTTPWPACCRRRLGPLEQRQDFFLVQQFAPPTPQRAVLLHHHCPAERRRGSTGSPPPNCARSTNAPCSRSGRARTRTTRRRGE